MGSAGHSEDTWEPDRGSWGHLLENKTEFSLCCVEGVLEKRTGMSRPWVLVGVAVTGHSGRCLELRLGGDGTWWL